MGWSCRKGGWNIIELEFKGLGYNRIYKRCFIKMFGIEVAFLIVYKWKEIFYIIF